VSQNQQPPGEPVDLVDVDVEWLWREVGPQLAALLRRAQLPQEDAEDLLHNTFVRLMERREGIREPVGWLIATVRYEVLAYWRLKRGVVVEQLEDALAARLRAPGTDSATLELRCDLERCLGELSDRCRDLIHQRYTLGLEPIELAPRIGYTTRGVRKLTRTCLNHLADHLAKRPRE
jgi:RNA polymerase sigma factor (sigma-70 family)